MASSKALNIAVWAAFALFVMLCFSSNFFYAPTTHPRQLRRNQEVDVHSFTSFEPKSVPVITRHSPGHQNPAVAPPKPLDEALRDVSLNDFSANNASGVSLSSRVVEESLLRRADGPLYCTNGPCVDGSCCGKNNICGYGPDYCGDGCQSQCNATAMCGEFSENAEMPCGMNLCCSATGWCGTTSVYCDNADPLHGTLPCQSGYGSCQTYATPSCGSGSTKGRSMGYYQSWNVRERKCNTVSPSQIDTSGYTHLYYAFASIDPATYSIVNAHPDDERMIPEFTALHRNGAGPQTWIAVGGFDFSDPGPTHTTWSDLCASKANRAAFISSVKAYMDKYGFQGVDLDWEYPGDPKRGGNKLADVRNFPILLREMRAAFGSQYGISLTLAPDYWYLRWFDAKAMEPYVDFFGFMAYDLHGSWDQDVLTLGKIIRGQADIREIDKNTIPLWFDGLNPAKINFGLAMYGRGYTVSDPSCNNMGCSFAEASKPGECTGFNGVLSLLEIKKLIKEKGWTSTYLPDSMMKQLTHEDQWIGYDDEETFAAKLAWADSRCFGGSMVWGIDYGMVGSGGPEDDLPVVYLDPTVYNQVPAQCNPACRLVFPPSSLSSPSTISVAPYTTSLEIAPGTTKTITVTVPAVTVTSMSYFNMIITSGQETTTIVPYQSVDIPHVTTVIDGQTRTLTLPPWPLITNGPPDQWTSSSTSSDPASGVPILTSVPIIPIPDAPTMTGGFPILTKTPYADGVPTSKTTTTLMPWPTNMHIEPVETPVPDEGEDDNQDDDEYTTTCKLWFFFICIKWDAPFDIEISGWKWKLPVGTFPPGPPPPHITFPPGFTLKGTLPPWPKITVHPGGSIEPAAKPADCTPAEASICMTKSYFATTVSAGATITTATSATERCATITGCNLRDIETDVSQDVCTLLPRRDLGLPLVALPEPTGAATNSSTGGIYAGTDTYELSAADEPEEVERQYRQHEEDHIHRLHTRATMDWKCEAVSTMDGIIYPRYESLENDVDIIRNLLIDRQATNGRTFSEIRSNALQYTALFVVHNFGSNAAAFFNSRQVIEAHGAFVIQANSPAQGNPTVTPRDILYKEERNDSSLDEPAISKRAIPRELNEVWPRSLMSFPPRVPFNVDIPVIHGPSQSYYASYWDDQGLSPAEPGKGQHIYIIESGMGDAPSHTPRRQDLNPGMTEWGIPYTPTAANVAHGATIAQAAVGTGQGIAWGATWTWVNTKGNNLGFDTYLEALIRIADDAAKRPMDTCIINKSAGWVQQNDFDEARFRLMVPLMTKMATKFGCIFVIAAGNEGNTKGGYPARAIINWPAANGVPARPGVPGMLIVGAVTMDGFAIPENSAKDYINAWAPGVNVPLFNERKTGTSYAAPYAAGLAAYIRAKPNPRGGTSPRATFMEMRRLARPIVVRNAQGVLVSTGTAVLYNGEPAADICAYFASLQPNPVPRRRRASLAGRQEDFEDGGSCPFVPGGGSSGGGGGSGGQAGPRGPPVSFRPGSPAPVCTANCGVLCSGIYCNPTAVPTVQPPDFTSPAPSATLVPTATNGGGDSPIDPSALPTLTAVPTGGPIPTNCASVSSWSTCALGLPPGASACQTFSTCVSTKKDTIDPSALPTLAPVPTGAPIPSNCASISTWANCALGVPPGMSACQTFSSCVSTSTTPTSDPNAVPTGPPTFYIYAEVVVTENADPKMYGHAISRKAKDFSENPGTNPLKHCNAIADAPTLVQLNGNPFRGDTPYYPWPEQEFKSWKNELCGKEVRFKKTGDDYDVFEGDKKVGVCTKGDGKDHFCFDWWSTTVTQIYACTGAC